jgi:hypothetical protein
MTNLELIHKVFIFILAFNCILLISYGILVDKIVNISLMTSKVTKFLQTHLTKELQAMK